MLECLCTRANILFYYPLYTCTRVSQGFFDFVFTLGGLFTSNCTGTVFLENNQLTTWVGGLLSWWSFLVVLLFVVSFSNYGFLLILFTIPLNLKRFLGLVVFGLVWPFSLKKCFQRLLWVCLLFGLHSTSWVGLGCLGCLGLISWFVGGLLVVCLFGFFGC